ncbi:MAG: hypothetical protein E7604_07410 [Ruminococcaceae bacterium]|nr:hypothetical protein [Oscillospiraceae bacterium]
MKKRIAVCLMVLSLCVLCILPTFAAQDDGLTITVAKSSGGIAYYTNMTNSTNPRSSVNAVYLYESSATTFTTVSYTSAGIAVDVYNSSTYQLLSSKLVKQELPLFGGFFAGEKYNYLVFCQNNYGHDDTVEVFRVVKYDKNFRRISAAAVRDCYTEEPTRSASLRMDEYNDRLVIHTSRKRYDGHQSQLSIVIDPTTMTVRNGLGDQQTNHVSHSFNQFVQFDETTGQVFYVDHGDGYPRGVSLNICTITPYNSSDGRYNLFPVPGTIGANYTGFSIGGFELSETNKKVLISINTIDHSLATGYSSYGISGISREERDAVLLVADYSSGKIDTSKVKKIYMTNYVGGGALAGIPQLVKINDNRYLYMWQLMTYTSNYSGKVGPLKYIYVDANGKKLSNVYTVEGAYSSCRCQPQLINGEVVWFINTDAGERTFYRIDPNHGKLKQSISVEMPSRVTYGDEPFKIGVTPDKNSKLADFTYTSDNPGVAAVSADGKVTVKGAGTATITITQSGNDNYVEAIVTKKLVVNKARIDIHADNAIKAVGTADPTYTYTYSGTIFDEAEFTGALSRVQGEEIGTYGIRRGSLSLGSNYVLNVQGGSLYIVDEVKAPTVTTESLPEANVGEVYHAALTVESPLEVTWNLISGTLPAGLTMENGEIAGTPTTEETAKLTFCASHPMLPSSEVTLTLAVHTYGEAVVTEEASCTKPGMEIRTCAVCRTEKKHTIPALGTAAQPYDGCQSAKFTDIAYGDWFHEAVDFARSHNLMNGTSETTFAPSAKISRAMIAQVLYNREGRPAQTMESMYSDVTPEKWYYDAMRWAEANALIIDTDGDGVIGADSEITREEIAMILWRYFKKPLSVMSLDAFGDVNDIAFDAVPAFRWAVEVGIYRGNDESRLNPKNNAMRSEAAQIFMNLFRTFDSK